MEKGITKPSILIVADDFTGANDAGVALAQVGHTVDVAFEMPYCGDASVWVINSDSRAMDPVGGDENNLADELFILWRITRRS